MLWPREPRRPWLGMEVTNLYAADVDILEKIVQKFPNVFKGVIVEEVSSCFMQLVSKRLCNLFLKDRSTLANIVILSHSCIKFEGHEGIRVP